MNSFYPTNNQRCPLLLPFLAGALVTAPIAYLAGNNNNEVAYCPAPPQPTYYYPPQPQPMYYYQPQPQPMPQQNFYYPPQQPQPTVTQNYYQTPRPYPMAK